MKKNTLLRHIMAQFAWLEYKLGHLANKVF